MTDKITTAEQEKAKTAEGNKLIAEFVGFLKLGNEIYNSNNLLYHCESETNWFASELKFHTSWDWLMQVVEKIESIRLFTDKVTTFYVIINACQCEIHQNTQHYMAFQDEMDFPNIDTDGDTKIEAVYKAVIQFIQWYNANHPSPTPQ